MRGGETGGEHVVDRLARLGMQEARAEDPARGGGVEGFEAAGGEGEGIAA